MENVGQQFITSTRLPDTSIQPDIVTRGIRDVKEIGAIGLEFLPYYNYGLGEETWERFRQLSTSQPEPDFPDWDVYGFGTPAYVSLFKDSLRAAKDADIVLDYALGANQAQGVPAVPGTPGLAVQLLMGNTTIPPGGRFSAPVPQPQLNHEALTANLLFMHPLQDYGAHNLTAVLAYELVMGKTSMIPVSLQSN